MGGLNDRLSPARNVKLPEYLADMRLDRRLADAKLVSDLLIEKPLSDELKHPDLSRGEFRNAACDVFRLPFLDEQRPDFAIHIPGDIDAARMDLPYGLRQILLAGRFWHKPRRAHPDRLRGNFRVVERGEDENRGLRKLGPDEKKAVEAGHAGKHEIEQNEIEAFAVRRALREFLDRAHFTDHGSRQGELNRALDRFTKHRMIFDDQYRRHVVRQR